jgi:Uma2 family endonuclease
VVSPMNIVVAKPADDLPPRRAFSVDDIRVMVDSGLIGEDERLELVGGEIVVMAAKSVAHDRIQNVLNLALTKCVPDGYDVGNGSTLQLGDDVLIEPDLAILAHSIYKADSAGFAKPRAADVLLVIEIAVSSMRYDRGVKARLYAAHGIREYWVIDANARVAWIHTGPSADGWATIVERGPDDALTTPALPGFSITLGTID